MDVIKGVGKAKGQYLIYTDDGEYICSTLDEDIANEIKIIMEKQIAKAVLPNKKIPSIGKCPICKTELCTDDESLHYCPTCGQALTV